MKIAYADCFSGISGDMFLASLIDVGLPLAWFLRWLPRSVRDWGYSVIARNRYRGR